MGIVLEGVSEFGAALKAMTVAMDAATRAATATGAHLIEAQIKTELARSSHPKGTPTPSRPGQPPALVSGRLRNSVRVEGPTSLGTGTWQARIGPTAVYSRVQELGGDTKRVVLPSRPYVQPAMTEVNTSGRLGAVYVDAWRAGMRGF